MRRGFTLVELLVVIAIIAVLAAILFPVFAKAREKARQVACSSDLRQVALAVSQYLEDSDEVAPLAGGYITWYQVHPRYGIGWLRKAYTYVRNLQVYQCPTNSTPIFGYSMNGWTMSQIDRLVNEAMGPYKPDLNPAPTQTPWIFDGYNPGTAGAPDWVSLNTADCDPDNSASRSRKFPYHWVDLYFPGVHNGGNNVAFLDGHVKWWGHFPHGIGDYDMDAQLAFFVAHR